VSVLRITNHDQDVPVTPKPVLRITCKERPLHLRYFSTCL